MIKYEYKYIKQYDQKKFVENGHTMFEEDVLQRLKRLAYLEEQVKNNVVLPDVSGMLPSFKELILQMNLRLKTDRSKMTPVDYGFGWQDCMEYLGFKHKRR